MKEKVNTPSRLSDFESNKTNYIRLFDYINDRIEHMQSIDPVKNRSLSLAEIIQVKNTDVLNDILMLVFAKELSEIDNSDVDYAKKNNEIATLIKKLPEAVKTKLEDDLDKLDTIKKQIEDKQLTLKEKEKEAINVLTQIEKIKANIEKDKNKKKQQLIEREIMFLLKALSQGNETIDELTTRTRPDKYIEPILRPIEIAGGFYGLFTAVSTAIAAFALLSNPIGIAITAAVVSGLLITGIGLGLHYAYKSYKTQRNIESADEMQLRIILAKENSQSKDNEALQQNIDDALTNKRKLEEEFLNALKEYLSQKAETLEEMSKNSMMREIEALTLEAGLNEANKQKIASIVAKFSEEWVPIDKYFQQQLNNYQSNVEEKPLVKKTYNQVDYYKKSLYTKQFVLEAMIAGIGFPGLAFGVSGLAALFIPGVNIAAGVGLAIFAVMSLLGIGMVFISRKAQAKRKDDIKNAVGEHTVNFNNDKAVNKERKARLGNITSLSMALEEMKQRVKYLPIQQPIPENIVQEGKIMGLLSENVSLRERNRDLEEQLGAKDLEVQRLRSEVELLKRSNKESKRSIVELEETEEAKEVTKLHASKVELNFFQTDPPKSAETMDPSDKPKLD